MKVKAIKNFFLYTGEGIEFNGEYEMPEEMALDLIRGGYVVELKADKKSTTKAKDKEVVEDKKPATKTRKKKADE